MKKRKAKRKSYKVLPFLTTEDISTKNVVDKDILKEYLENKKIEKVEIYSYGMQKRYMVSRGYLNESKLYYLKEINSSGMYRDNGFFGIYRTTTTGYLVLGNKLNGLKKIMRKVMLLRSLE